MRKILLLFICLSAVLANAQTLTVTPTTTNVTCFGANNGTATIAVSGCTGTPTYVWSPNVSTTNSATGLAPGTYTVNVTTPASTGSDTLFFDNFEGALKWNLNTNIGSQGGTPNLWVINSASPYGGSCSPSAGGNSMHITCGGGFACSLFAPNGEAAYNASGAASVTDRYTSVLSDISTVGRTNVQVKFTYVCNG
ncbi:MAG: hypothetical protein M0D57_19910 [Sphingobacteriales bacterium JAD_PAG50586_3]|nr:MAG: hypothetical protein M0D57_19910 [Sphingobacteriales bacterium JAD_PAG50586_3]